MPLYFGGQGVTPNLEGLPGTNTLTLAPGQVWPTPAGWFNCELGLYTIIQEFDTVVGGWINIGGNPIGASLQRHRSDGTNYRLANQTGCAVGANLTAAGSGYLTPPLVVPSAGGSIWRAIVGGAISTSVTVTNGGTGYTYPPIIAISAPPTGGIPATAHSVLTSGVVSSVVVDNQGAGYTSLPTLSFINDPREGQNNTSIGVNASAICSLTGGGTVTGIICLDHGGPLSAVPTLTISGGSGTGAAATPLMCWTIVAYTVSAGGTAYAAPIVISAIASPVTGSAYLNPMTQQNLVRKRQAVIIGAQSGGVITAAGQTVIDGGIYDVVPTVYISNYMATGASAVFTAPTMGGVVDTTRIYPG